MFRNKVLKFSLSVLKPLEEDVLVNTMDIESSTSNNTRQIVTQIRRLGAILSVLSFIILEIWVCYSLSHIEYNNGKKDSGFHPPINLTQFNCNNINPLDSERINLCKKLVNIFQLFNNTYHEISLTENEWVTLVQLLR